MPRKNSTQNSAVEIPAPATPVESNVVAARRGRKPSPYSRDMLAADVETFVRGGSLPEGKYTVTPRQVGENGQITSFEVISTPPILRTDGNKVRLIQWQTNGKFNFGVDEVTLGVWGFDGTSFYLITE